MDKDLQGAWLELCGGGPCGLLRRVSGRVRAGRRDDTGPRVDRPIRRSADGFIRKVDDRACDPVQQLVAAAAERTGTDRMTEEVSLLGIFIMNIQIRTKNDEGKRCDDCPFLDQDFLKRRAKCLLFRETLTPRMKWGDVEYWNTCEQCSHVVSAHNSLPNKQL